ncbi:acyl-CoA desaturase [Asticcacaulis solisilvae]|uniref:acyl-CoA desaturase n=1 Tax=Asticcacaulis solisilvae TaxID=1217274 RepID=UPI003FD7ABB7
MGKDFENIARIADGGADAVKGKVVWSPVRSLFLLAMYAGTVTGAMLYLRIDTVLLFTVKTVAVLLLGHSVGMHRRLIHKSFSCPLWLEHGLVYMGTLVGLGGPFAMIRTHDFRDWAQRQPLCHDYFAHRQPPLTDAVWQMHCELCLSHPPRLDIEPEVANDRFYRLIDRHWIAVHAPWAVAFFLMGGWGWVLWGVCAQVAVTVTGHWLIGHMAHTDHAQDWQVRGAGVQGRNVDFAGLITMGESWHNNHHAFPGSARIGLYEGQSDPGYWFLKALEPLGLVWDIRLPQHLPHRPALHWTGEQRPVPRPERRPCAVMTRLGALLRV